MSLRQTSYIERVTEAHFPEGVPNAIQSNSTPCTAGIEGLVLEAMERAADPCPKLLKRYQSVVGGLLYCSTNTRPDIVFAVGITPCIFKTARAVAKLHEPFPQWRTRPNRPSVSAPDLGRSCA